MQLSLTYFNNGISVTLNNHLCWRKSENKKKIGFIFIDKRKRILFGPFASAPSLNRHYDKINFQKMHLFPEINGSSAYFI